jgi:hypothetical protein
MDPSEFRNASRSGKGRFRPAGLFRRALLALLIFTFGGALAFIVLIVGNFEDAIALHEIAGLVLLILLLGALWAAVKLRRVDTRPMVRVGMALVFLVVAGALGAILATGSASALPSGLPLVPLALLLLSVADGIRITWTLPVSAVPPAI